jgi:hypothetical protein
MISRFDYLEEMRTFNCLRLEYTHKPFQENVEVDVHLSNKDLNPTVIILDYLSGVL